MRNLKKCFVMTGMASIVGLATPLAHAAELKVVSTFSIISDFAQTVGGDRIELTTLVGPDADSHSYEPRPADAIAIGNADLILANGLHLEGFLQRLVQASGTKATVVELTEGAKLIRHQEADDHDGHSHSHDHSGHGRHEHGHDHSGHARHEHEHEHGHGHDHAHGHDHGTAKNGATEGHHAHHHHGEYDPHAWQAVHNARIYVDNIAAAFCAADEEGCPVYKKNADSYGEKLDALDSEIKATIARIPSQQRTLITSHDAFRYFGQEYGLQFLAPQGMSTEAEASAADVAKLIGQIRQQRVSAIFVENISNPKLVEQIARETGTKIGDKLYSDALSAANGPAATYIDMMRHNADAIANAIADPQGR